MNIVLMYLIRGLAAGIVVFYIVTSLTGIPAYSMGIIAGLAFTVPLSSRRFSFFTLLYVLLVTVLHVVHVVYFHWFNSLYELTIVLVSWMIIFWVNVTERWRSIGGSDKDS